MNLHLAQCDDITCRFGRQGFIKYEERTVEVGKHRLKTGHTVTMWTEVR